MQSKQQLVPTVLVGKDQLHKVHKFLRSLLPHYNTRLLHKVRIVVVPDGWVWSRGGRT